MITLSTRIRAAYRWARDTEAPDSVTGAALIFTLGSLYFAFQILVERVS